MTKPKFDRTNNPTIQVVRGTGPSIRPRDFRSKQTREERLADCGKILPLWRKGKVITAWCYTDCNVAGCKRCGAPERRQVMMFKRRGARGSGINRRAREQALDHLRSGGVTEVLTYDSARSKAQMESIRRVTKGKFAVIQDRDGRSALLIPPSCREFIIGRCGKPKQQSPLDEFTLEDVLSRSAVKRMDGMLGARRFKVAPVAQDLNPQCNDGTVKPEAATPAPDRYTISIRPSDFETDARHLGKRSAKELHEMGYRLLGMLMPGDTWRKIDDGAAGVVPLNKEEGSMSDIDQIKRMHLLMMAKLDALPHETAAIVREELGKSDEEVMKLRAERRRRETQ
ncbi:MAG: hypothetical protein LAO30_23460 [Acidobacteriia bacterium]|nr:hypothetical protein [Terriglobia bacterium]